MNREYILVIDRSTSGTKAFIPDGGGNLIFRADKPHRQKISSEGWISHDPMEIFTNTIGAA
jgi:glycerol kinase